MPNGRRIQPLHGLVASVAARWFEISLIHDQTLDVLTDSRARMATGLGGHNEHHAHERLKIVHFEEGHIHHDEIRQGWNPKRIN